MSDDEDQLTRVRRRLGASGPASVSMVAQGIVDRLKHSGEEMATKVEFRCRYCQDAGVLKTETGWKPCTKCPDAEAAPKKTIF